MSPEDCLVWDESRPTRRSPSSLAQLGPPAFPTPIGVLRAVEEPTYEAGVVAQIEHEIETRGVGNLEQLLYGGETWTVG